MIRGLNINDHNPNWYNGVSGPSSYHAGLDIRFLPNATSSEDSFTYHDSLNENHRCHVSAGEIVVCAVISYWY